MEFQNAPAALTRVAPLDPAKHVNYTLGMVLGVDDFDQEFVYSSNRDRWLARDLIGYGTVSGLRVTVEGDAVEPRVRITAGTAVTPSGLLVCVPCDQCAKLDEWLAALEVRDKRPLHVVLCYRECLTDDVPIPGEPCRTEDRMTEASRVLDDFRLELRDEPPAHHEEHGLRELVAWLRRIPVVGSGEGELELDALRAAMREAARPALDALANTEHPPAAPLDLLQGDPPADLRIPAADQPQALRAAFALWVTELRPALASCPCGTAGSASGACGCGPIPPQREPCGSDAVLLATLDPVEAAPGWRADEADRAYLLHTRLLQEWLLTGPAHLAAAGPASTPGGNPIQDIRPSTVEGDATAHWDRDTGVLKLGVPRGEKGQNGKDGRGIKNVLADFVEPNERGDAKLGNDDILRLQIPKGEKGEPGGVAASPPSPVVVAAGRWTPSDERLAPDWTFPREGVELTTVLNADPSDVGLMHLTFEGFAKDRRYVVKGIVETSWTGNGQWLEIVTDDEDLHGSLSFRGVEFPAEPGLLLRVRAEKEFVGVRALSLEITDYSEVT